MRWSPASRTIPTSPSTPSSFLRRVSRRRGLASLSVTIITERLDVAPSAGHGNSSALANCNTSPNALVASSVLARYGYGKTGLVAGCCDGFTERVTLRVIRCKGKEGLSSRKAWGNVGHGSGMLLARQSKWSYQ